MNFELKSQTATKGGSLPGFGLEKKERAGARKEMTNMDTITSDTETGGLYPSVNALLSIGACCSWSEARFLAYITVESQPGKTIEAEAARVNGYTPERWKERGAVNLAAAFDGFSMWLEARKKERPGAVIVCHHLAFDKSFLHEAGRITGHDLQHRNDWRCSQVEFGRLMDVGLIARGSSALNRLRELSGWNGGREAEHDALEDARITLHGWQWLAAVAKRPELTLRELYMDSLKKRQALEDALKGLLVPYVVDDFFPECATPGYRAAVERVADLVELDLESLVAEKRKGRAAA